MNTDGSNCTYAYTWEHTPVAYHNYDNATAGEIVTIDLMGWKVTPITSPVDVTRNFPWFCEESGLHLQNEATPYSYSYGDDDASAARYSYSYGDDPYGCTGDGSVAERLVD